LPKLPIANCQSPPANRKPPIANHLKNTIMSTLKIEYYYTIEKSANGVATIWMDQKGEKINKIGPELIELFDEVFVDIEKDPAIKAVVLISKKKDFIAGADIESFQKVTKKGDFEPVT
jgi:enoyl-CoA hydratase/carnithine racemase